MPSNNLTPNSFRYHVTNLGWRVALFFTRTYSRLLRRAALPALRAVATSLRKAFDALTTKIDAMITQAQLATQNAEGSCARRPRPDPNADVANRRGS